MPKWSPFLIFFQPLPIHNFSVRNELNLNLILLYSLSWFSCCVLQKHCALQKQWIMRSTKVICTGRFMSWPPLCHQYTAIYSSYIIRSPPQKPSLHCLCHEAVQLYMLQMQFFHCFIPQHLEFGQVVHLHDVFNTKEKLIISVLQFLSHYEKKFSISFWELY